DRAPAALLSQGGRRHDRHGRPLDRGGREGDPAARAGGGAGRPARATGPRSGPALTRRSSSWGGGSNVAGKQGGGASRLDLFRARSPRPLGAAAVPARGAADRGRDARLDRASRHPMGGGRARFPRRALGGERRCGDVELHLTPSGWRAHGHRRDGAYASVILHVVLRRDPFSEPPRDLPLLVLEPYLHGAVAPAAERGAEDLDALGEEWFAERRARMERALERTPGDEVLYREILVALGYKHNKAAMAELARRCPLALLDGDAGAVERRLRAGAAELPRALWRLRNVRPANHPWRRLAEMARFVAGARDGGLVRGLAVRPALAAMTGWLGDAGIGPTRSA